MNPYQHHRLARLNSAVLLAAATMQNMKSDLIFGDPLPGIPKNHFGTKLSRRRSPRYRISSFGVPKLRRSVGH